MGDNMDYEKRIVFFKHYSTPKDYNVIRDYDEDYENLLTDCGLSSFITFENKQISALDSYLNYIEQFIEDDFDFHIESLSINKRNLLFHIQDMKNKEASEYCLQYLLSKKKIFTFLISEAQLRFNEISSLLLELSRPNNVIYSSLIKRLGIIYNYLIENNSIVNQVVDSIDIMLLDEFYTTESEEGALDDKRIIIPKRLIWTGNPVDFYEKMTEFIENGELNINGLGGSPHAIHKVLQEVFKIRKLNTKDAYYAPKEVMKNLTKEQKNQREKNR